MKKRNGGFSLLELVVAVFLIALVIASTLLIIAANLNIIMKANERMISTTLAMYQIETVKNIDFPPIYYDTQDNFGHETTVDPPTPGYCAAADFTPPEFATKLRVERYVYAYDESGAMDTAFDNTRYDRAQKLKILTYIIRKKGNYVLLQITTWVSRNGLY